MAGADRSALPAALRAELIRLYPGEAAAILDDADPGDAAAVLSAEDVAPAREALMAMAPPSAAHVVEALTDDAFRGLARGLDPDRAARLLGGLDGASRESRIGLLGDPLAAEVQAILRYPPTQAGSMMDTRFVAFPRGATARVALSEVRARAGRTRDVFVLDDAGRVLGAVSVEELALASRQRELGDLPLRTVPSVGATAPVDEAGERLSELEGHSLPVLDFDGRMMGVIRSPELVEAAERAATADIQKMVGAGSEERALSPPWLAVRKRLPWLYVNLLTAFVAASVVALFEDTIARFTALAVLLPLAAGQAGNSGAQTLAVAMRGLALREFRVSQWRRVARKEAAAGLLNGAAIALVAGLGAFLWSGSLGLGVVVGASMILSMTVAGLAGTLIPISLQALGQDPAQSSSIVLTTVTDVVGFLSFLGLATLLSRFI